MINEIVVPGPNRGTNFPDHALAHEWLDGKRGVELGASAHNRNNLLGSINIAPADDEKFYMDGQVAENGRYAMINFYGEAHDLPFKPNTLQYIISNHVFEHLPDPIAVLLEWERCVKDDGIIFMTVPQRTALSSDVGRELSTWEEWLRAYSKHFTPDTMPEEITKAAGGRRGHYFVYSSESLKALIEKASEYTDDFNWELVAEEDPDKKVGNGFVLVYKVHKTKADKVLSPAEQRLVSSVSEGHRSPEEYTSLIPIFNIEWVAKQTNKAVAPV